MQKGVEVVLHIVDFLRGISEIESALFPVRVVYFTVILGLIEIIKENLFSNQTQSGKTNFCLNSNNYFY